MTAFFNTLKGKSKTAPKKATVSPSRAGDARHHVLMRPHITEKASLLAEHGVYVFQIAPESGKREVALAVSAHYGVSPRKIHIIRTPRRAVFTRGKKGTLPSVKKAMVYLKKGDTIEII